MISLTRLNGERVAVNAELIERAEETPDTVLTLTNGTRYVIAEALDEVVSRIETYRATILALARRFIEDTDVGTAQLRVLRGLNDDEGSAPPPALPTR